MDSLNIRQLIYYEFKGGVNAADTAKRINERFGERTVSENTVQNLFHKFQIGEKSFEDKKHGPIRPVDLEVSRQLMNCIIHKTTRELAKELNDYHEKIMLGQQQIDNSEEKANDDNRNTNDLTEIKKDILKLKDNTDVKSLQKIIVDSNCNQLAELRSFKDAVTSLKSSVDELVGIKTTVDKLNEAVDGLENLTDVMVHDCENKIDLAVLKKDILKLKKNTNVQFSQENKPSVSSKGHSRGAFFGPSDIAITSIKQQNQLMAEINHHLVDELLSFRHAVATLMSSVDELRATKK